MLYQHAMLKNKCWRPLSICEREREKGKNMAVEGDDRTEGDIELETQKGEKMKS